MVADRSPLQVDEAVWTHTLTDLQACLPCEGVGLWAGYENRVLAWHPLQNVAGTPRTRYEVHPQAWLDVLRQIRLSGQMPLALVHSHPTADAVPSVYDRTHWYYQDLWCVIVTFASDPPIWRAHQL